MQAADGAKELQIRVSALDAADIRDDETAPPRSADREISTGDAKAFIGVLRDVTSNGRHDETPIASSPDADAVISECRLIGRLGALQPALVSGEITGLPQYWISTGNPP